MIGKAKMGLLISGILIVTLAISTLWLYTKADTLQRQVSTLQTEKDDLQIQINNLQTLLNNLEIENTNLQNQVNSLQWQIDSLLNELNETRFFFYYVKQPEQKFGVYDLSDELNSLEWSQPYQAGVFDCSEMSANLEWYLENRGWHTIIVIGDAPFGDGYHVWLLVETSVGHYMPVESTTIEVVWWSNPNFDNYFIYDYQFETIQEAEAYNESEFDWWKSAGLGSKILTG